MSYWDRNEFEKAAAQIVNSFMAGGSTSASLTEMVTKTARDASLNPEQISRLSRAVNTKAFNAKFAAMKTEKDRMVDFELADEQSAVQSLYKEAAPTEKIAADQYPDLPNQLKAQRGQVLPLPVPLSTEKIASTINAAIGSVERPDRQYIHWSKVAAELRTQTRQAEIRWEHTMRQLKEACSRIVWNHDTFEKNATAWFGDRAFPELTALREMTKRPAPNFTSEKLASAQDFLVGIPSAETSLLKIAIEAREEFVQRREAAAEAATNSARFQKQALHG